MKQGILFLGDAGTGKTTQVLQSFLANDHSTIHKSSVLLLPNQSQVEHCKELLLQSKVGGFFDGSIVTFYSLAHRLVSSVRPCNVISGIGRELVVSRLNRADTYFFLKPTAHTRGFRNAFLYTLQQLKSQGIMPEDIKSLFKTSPDNVTTKEKWDELAMMYQEYQDYLRQNSLVDREDILLRALKELESQPDHFSDIDLLMVDGFHDYSLLERKLLEQLIHRIPKAIVTLLYDPHHQAPEMRNSSFQTYRWLKGLGFQEKTLTVNHRTAKRDLQRLNRQIFSSVQRGEQPVDGFQIFFAENRTHEIETIAREIAFLVKRCYYDFRDCAVIFRHIQPYQTVIKETFSRYGIPFRIYASQPLQKSRSAQKIFCLLKMLRSGWQEEQILGFLRITAQPDRLSDIDALSFLIKRHRFLRGAKAWLDILKTTEYNWIWDLLTWIKEWEEKGKSLKNIDEICVHIKECLHHLFLIDYEDAVKQTSRGMDAREYNLAIQHLFTIIDEIRRHYGHDSKVVWHQILELLEEQIRSGSFRPMHRQRNVVNIIDVLESRQWEKKVVFVAGLVEKEFPSLGGTNFFWNERERHECNKRGRMYLPGIAENYAEEQFLFYVAITRAKDRLYVSFPVSDDRGKELQPSSFLMGLRAVFAINTVPPSSALQSYRSLSCGSRLLFPSDMRRQVFSTLQNTGWQEENNEVVKGMYRHLLQDPRVIQLLRRYLSPPKAELNSAEIRRIAGSADREYSASQLETFAVCPYRYFAAHILDVELPAEVDRRGLTPLDEGIIVHKVIELFYKFKKQKPVEDIFEEEFRSYVRRFELTIEDDKKKRNMLDCLREFVRFEEQYPLSGLTPIYFEHKFGSSHSGPLRINRADGSDILLRGKIDRVDVLEFGNKKLGVVIDYKYSKGTSGGHRVREIEEGMSLQLPLYLMALEQVLNIKLAAGIIFYLISLERRGIVRFSETVPKSLEKIYKDKKFQKTDMDALLETSREYIRKYAAKIEQGEISLQTDDPGACGIKNCDFTDVCRSQLHKRVIREE